MSNFSRPLWDRDSRARFLWEPIRENRHVWKWYHIVAIAWACRRPVYIKVMCIAKVEFHRKFGHTGHTELSASIGWHGDRTSATQRCETVLRTGNTSVTFAMGNTSCSCKFVHALACSLWRQLCFADEGSHTDYSFYSNSNFLCCIFAQGGEGQLLQWVYITQNCHNLN